MPEYEAVLADASQLPVDAQLQLIDALWDTLPEDALPPLSDEWLAEIQRRSAEFDAGTVQAVSWEEVKKEALQHVALSRKSSSHESELEH